MPYAPNYITFQSGKIKSILLSLSKEAISKKSSLRAAFLLIEMIIFVVYRKDKWYNVSRNMW